MNGIKLVLVSSFLLLLVWAIRNRRRVGLQAGSRLLAVAIALLAIVSVLQPDITQWLAERLGVTRGTDLVLYLLVVVSATSWVSISLRFRDQEHRLATVVRTMALRDAVVLNSPPGDGAPGRSA